MANATILNATTFTTAPVMSGANITSATIPLASVVGTLVDLSSNQSITGIKTFTQQPGTTFTTSFASQNTMYGYLAGNGTTSATNNTIFGYNAGPVLTSSADNVLVGYNAGLSMSTGTGQNVFVGSGAGQGYTTGINNVCIGYSAASSKLTGDSNVFIGSIAGATSTAISNCVHLGFAASGTASNQTILGAFANGGAFNQSTALGFSATCTAANQIMLGTATEFVQCPGTTGNGSIVLAGAMFNNMAQTTVSGSTSGNLVWSQPQCGSAYKRVVIYCGNSAPLVGTATVTFTNPFVKTPGIVIDSTAGGVPASVVTTLSTSQAIITGSSSTGFIFLEGY